MNILLITEFFPTKTKFQASGGVEVRTYYISKYLKKNNKVKVISRQSVVPTATLWSVFSRMGYIFLAMWKAAETNFDLVEGSNWISHIPAYIGGRLKRKPSVAWFADVYKRSWFDYFSLPTAVLGYFLEMVALKLPWGRVIAMSETTKVKLVRSGIQPDKIDVIYGGVEAKLLSKKHFEKYEVPTVVTVARLVNYKRVEVLIKAFKLLKANIPNVRLIIIGDGPEMINLKNLVNKLDLEKSVIFKGTFSHDRTIDTIAKSWIFCLPSVIEGFGLVTVEAMAVGTPYVNSDIVTNKEITNDGKGGELFEADNYKDLFKKIESLITNKAKYKQKVTEGMEFVKRYEWNVIGEKTENSYKRAISSQRLLKL